MIVAAVEGQTFLDALGANVPLILGLLTFLGGVLAFVLVKPPAYKELADEARSLRGDLEKSETKADKASDDVRTIRREIDRFRDEWRNERNAYQKRVGILSDGVEGMWQYVSVLKDALNHAGAPIPEPSDYLNDLMARARQARTEDFPPTVDTGPVNL